MLNSTSISPRAARGGEPTVSTVSRLVKKIMTGKLRRRKPLAALICVALLMTMLGGCDDDDRNVIRPGNFPDVRGAWSGQYRVTGCSLSGAADPFFCSVVFAVDQSLILDLDLDQSGPDVFGVIAQGELLGDVDGVIDEVGILQLFGDIGDAADPLSTRIVAWQTGLVGDSLVGSWRFRVFDQGGSGFGTATVDASLKTFGSTVAKFFGCAARGSLTADGLVSGGLALGDCQLSASLFVEGLEDGQFFDVFTFRGSAGDSIDVVLSSANFDAFLLVADLEELVLGGDDDSGGGVNGTDAAVTLVFETSETLLLIVTSFSPGEVGGYSLSAALLGTSSPLMGGGSTGRIRVIGDPSVAGKAGAKVAPTVDPIRKAVIDKVSRPPAWPPRR